MHRQGEVVTVDITTKYTHIQTLTNKNYGQASLFNNDVLIVNGSVSVDFFHHKKKDNVQISDDMWEKFD